MATRRQRSMPSATGPSLRIAQITVENYKSLDELSLELPAPSTPDQLDAFVLGSKNGVGKSSMLECCALGIIGAVFPEILSLKRRPRDFLDPHDLLIRSGARQATIRAHLGVGGATQAVELALGCSGSAGRAAERAVAVDLLKNHQDELPADFIELKAILERVT